MEPLDTNLYGELIWIGFNGELRFPSDIAWLRDMSSDDEKWSPAWTVEAPVGHTLHHDDWSGWTSDHSE